jgi:hypothetical protein
MTKFVMGAVATLVLGGCGSDVGSGSSRGGGTVALRISAENLGVDGFPFPGDAESHMVDGWSVSFSHVIVTVGKVTLSTDPDLEPTNQSKTGPVVARAEGPWAVDLAQAGPLGAQGGEGTAFPLTAIASQTENGGAAFANDERYAFGYETLAASDGAARVGFDDESETLYADMIRRGDSVLYVGEATFAGAACKSADDSYDFSKIPSPVPFQLGFPAPTSYVNCQNQANDGDAFPDEEYQRGIAVPSNRAAPAQITLHLEHAFYSDVRHEPPLYFGQIAARAVGKDANAVVTLDDLVGVDPTAFEDGNGKAIPFRSCDGSPLPATPQMSFDLGSVPLDPKGDPSRTLRDYRDFITFVTSTQGHFDGGEGLCFVQRNFPAPRL